MIPAGSYNISFGVSALILRNPTKRIGIKEAIVLYPEHSHSGYLSFISYLFLSTQHYVLLRETSI